ncbi:MAG: S41 family peptidase [Bryobacteraceae bacterium]
MSAKRVLMTMAALTASAWADLTPDQKEFDMRVLAASYARNYAPAEWKKQVFGFDIFDIADWVRRARESKDDLEFWEICAEYVASLRDSHSSFSIPSLFQASLGFTADLYGDKPVIDAISRSVLPAARYPFGRGWEVVSVDGAPAEETIARLSRFVYMANDRSRRRVAASYLGFRPQSRFPRAHEIGAEAVVVVKSPAGEEQTYTIPWRKSGTPATSAGKLPSPVAPRESRADAPEDAPSLTDYTRDIVESPGEVNGVGSRTPIYALPAGFQMRQGRLSSDVFLSGVYLSGDLRIGLIRIPNFAPSSTSAALRTFEGEIQFMQENTDGLVVDITRNNGGDACYNEEIQRRLIPYEFRGIGREIRLTTRFLISFSNELEAARARSADPESIAQLEARLAEYVQAFREGRPRTGPLAVCAGTLQRQPAAVVYTKPVLTLIDEFSISAADGFAAVMQDARRGKLFGWRTNGAGGTTGSFPATVYSEAFASHTIAMHNRREPIVTNELPTAPYVENIGVRPDILYDLMTLDELNNDFRWYVIAFTEAISEMIRAGR